MSELLLMIHAGVATVWNLINWFVYFGGGTALSSIPLVWMWGSFTTNGLAASIFAGFWTYGVGTGELVAMALSYFMDSHDLAILFVPMIGYYNALIAMFLPFLFALLWSLNTVDGPWCTASTTACTTNLN